MRHYFLYDGVNSKHFHAWIASGNVFDAPKRDVSEIEVPGRNGTLTIDNGRFCDMDLPYVVYVPYGFEECICELRNFLMRTSGYRRLEDTFHPDEYRLAKYIEAFVISESDRMGGYLNVNFRCKPQRFLKSGEILVSCMERVKLWNPTKFDALPWIRVYGESGRLLVGDIIVQLNSIDGYVDLDCDTQNAYKGTVNCNNTIYAPDFPKLPEGMTEIAFEGKIDKIEIIPRWWRI